MSICSAKLLRLHFLSLRMLFVRRLRKMPPLQIVNAVYKNFFVDDLSKSCSGVDEAVDSTKQRTLLLRRSDFHPPSSFLIKKTL